MSGYQRPGGRQSMIVRRLGTGLQADHRTAESVNNIR